MRRLLVLTLAGGLLVLPSLAFAGSSATQTVTYQVQAINEVSASGNPAALVVSAAMAGSQPGEVTNTATTYAITTNETKKITAAIDTAMPANVTLKINLTAPTGGSSAGDVTLTAVAADVVTGVSQVAESGKTITYKLSATVAAGVVASATKTVTLTIAAP